MASQHFRAGVMVVVRHPDMPLVLALERFDTPGSWQLPQGGLDIGEEPIEGAWRELQEETGLVEGDVEARAEYPDWTLYEWPRELRDADAAHAKPGRRGQVHRWFLFDALDPEVVPRPDGREFRDWRWVEPRWLIDHVVEWRRPAYERVLTRL